MALVNCPECGGSVSDEAKICPHCGYDLKKKRYTKEEKELIQKKKAKKDIISGIITIVCCALILLAFIKIDLSLHSGVVVAAGPEIFFAVLIYGGLGFGIIIGLIHLIDGLVTTFKRKN